MSYYNLSGEESEEESDESDQEQDLSAGDNAGLWGRMIVHLDVDCFYCQCEEIDGPPSYRQRPLAIGQKHIIVTSNYIARQHGVKKLQSRDAAYIACPNLLILEGSDLENYRKHSRKIHLAFRDGLKRLAKEAKVNVQVRKGGMDESFADITELVHNQKRQLQLPPNTFIYGDSPSRKSTIVEDQSGATVAVQHQSYIASSDDNVHAQYGTMHTRQECQQRLHTAAALCEQVRHEIKLKTRFTTTMGISISRMLSKLTSDLQKPDSLNVLYPWRSGSILLPMPLRKIPELGHSTLRLLKECLKNHHVAEPTFWTCQDLLRVPISQIKASLNHIKPTEEASGEHCIMLLDKCRGLDTAMIEDDNGGLTKQVSVEDSFRRGTMLTKESIWKAVEELFVRLPKLLEERQSASPNPSQAYPATIRLTARVVDPKITGRRRPYNTTSKQCSFDGKHYMKADKEKRRNMLQVVITPLLNILVLKNPEYPQINVTRMNIAATNFQDLGSSSAATTIAQFTSQRRQSPQQPPLLKKRDREEDSKPLSKPNPSRNPAPQIREDEIDASVLAELPPEIAAEVRQMYQPKQQKKKRQTIDCFFQRK